MKALLGAAAFGLLPVPSMTSSRRNVWATGKETGSLQFAAPSQAIGEKLTATDKPHEQQYGVRHNAPYAPARQARMRGVAVMLMIAVLLIGGVVASVRADRWSATAVSAHLND